MGMYKNFKRNIAFVLPYILVLMLALSISGTIAAASVDAGADATAAATAATAAASSTAISDASSGPATVFSYECNHDAHASLITDTAYDGARIIKFNESGLMASPSALGTSDSIDFSDAPDYDLNPLRLTDIGKQRLSDNNGLPKSVDNSALKYFPPIGDQGMTNSCGNYALGYYVSTYMTALARDIDVKNQGDSAIYSPGFWYETPIGSVPLQVGLVTLDKWPWNEQATVLSKPVPPQLWREAFQNRADSIINIYYPQTPESLSLLRQYLLNGYVFAIYTDIEDWHYWYISDNPYTTSDDAEVGKFIASFEQPEENYGSHAMTIVGYNDEIWLDANENSIVEDNELGAYKIANSWGTSYANDGYIWLSYNDVAAFVSYFETYIFNEEKYNPLLIAEYELIGPLPEYDLAYPIMYFNEYLGWALHDDPDNIYYEPFWQMRGVPIGENTYMADLTDIITDNALDLETVEYDWYIMLVPFYPMDDKIYPFTLKSAKLTDMDGVELVGYDGALPLSMIGDESIELKITYGNTSGGGGSGGGEALVSITGPATVASGGGATAAYTISVKDMPPVGVIELEFEVDGAFLSPKEFLGQGGFTLMNAGNYGTPIYWKIDGDKWTGKATLLDLGAGGGNGGSGGGNSSGGSGVGSGNGSGGSGGSGGNGSGGGVLISGDADILSLVFDVNEGALGTADVKLNYIIMSYAGSPVDAKIVAGSVTTEFVEAYSPYDLNKDGIVDLYDLAWALQYMFAQEGDSIWDIAKAADFTKDGYINTDDLMAILENYTNPYY